MAIRVPAGEALGSFASQRMRFSQGNSFVGVTPYKLANIPPPNPHNMELSSSAVGAYADSDRLATASQPREHLR